MHCMSRLKKGGYRLKSPWKSNEKKYPASADATEKGWGPPSIANNS